MSSPAAETVPGGMVPQHAPLRWTLALVALWLAVCSAGCTGSNQSSPDASLPQTPTSVTAPSATVQGGPLVFTDSALPVVIVPGQAFSIRVSATPSTGYVWQVTGSPDPTVLNLIDPEGTFEPPEPQLPGAGGFQVFELGAIAPGTTQLQLTYARPFDPADNPTVETFTVKVT